MRKEKEQFYLVDLRVLPEAIKKTIKVKEMLQDGVCGSINEAVKKVDMSRSAYYKYKDHVIPAWEKREHRIAILFMFLSDDLALFTKLMRRVARGNYQILSFSRGLAAEKMAVLTMTIKLEDDTEPLGELKEALANIKGVESVVVEESSIRS